MHKIITLLLACILAASSGIAHAASSTDITFTTLAGSPGTVVNSADGTGSDAQFSQPRGIAIDSSGTLYIADSSNHTIRKVTPGGEVTTLAGTAGTQGHTDGTGTASTLTEPFGIALDSSGNIYVADSGNSAIRKITPEGVVSTFAGGGGQGTADGTGTGAKFREPRGIAVDSSDNIYVADYTNHTIRKITPAGVVTTIAGSAGNSGSTDGVGSAARFLAPQGIAVDSAGVVYVADTGNKMIRKITTDLNVTTLVDGSDGALGDPRGMTIDTSGTLYVADFLLHVIHKVTAAGELSTWAGSATVPGSSDGSGAAALFNTPSGLVLDSTGNLYIVDTSNSTVRKLAPDGTVTTFAGLAGRSSSLDGVGSAARFEDPYAVAADSAGNVYVADATDHSIRKITPDGTVTTLAGKAGSFGSTDGTGNAARFFGPLGIAVDGSGSVFVADTGNQTVRKISASGVVTTLAGSAGLKGSTNGSGSNARFNGPHGIAVDGAGNVYVAEDTADIRKIDPNGVVTTVAGKMGSVGFVDGTSTDARFQVLFDLDVDTAGNLYVCDHGNHAIRKITPSGVVTTLAGSGSPGYSDGTGTAALLKFPSSVAVDTSGNMYVADTDNQVIRKITSSGIVTTVAGTHALGSSDGIGTAASFTNPKGIAIDGDGNLYIADRGNHTIRKGSMQTAATACPGITLSSSGQTADASGLTGNLNVTTDPGCAWTATSNDSWITLSSGSSGSGSGTVVYSVAANADTSSRTGTITLEGQTFTVTQAGASGTASTGSVTVYEFYHAGLNHYFRTADSGEAAGIDSGAAGPGWVRTGDDFPAYPAATTSGGAVDVCRFYGSVSPGPNSHFYTADPGECDGLKALQLSTPDSAPRWNYEGQAFAIGLPSSGACPAGSAAIYRLYNNGSSKGEDSNHRYTTLTGEYQALQSAGWSGEGVVMCAPSSTLSPPANVSLANVSGQTVGSSMFSSSTQLTATWVAPSDYSVDHYAISASESLGNTRLSFSANAGDTSATLTGLKSGTDYSVVVAACADAACTQTGAASAVTATTSEEYWQLQGSGNSYSTLSSTVSDGSVLSWVMRWGADAGSAYAGRYQYYYKTSASGRVGVGIATTSGNGTDVTTLTAFSPLTTSGLRSACSNASGTDTSTCAVNGAFEISAIQAVPLASGKIRVYFEASDVLDNTTTRIYSLDSQDGLVGQDFHSGATQAYCGGIGSDDYAPGGACAFELLVDVSSTPSASTPLSQSRQFKIGYDWNTDWRWDGAAGAFMVITGDDNCGNYPNALFYATWDSSKWSVAQDSSNCAKPLVQAAHGPVLVPLGTAAYKLYYEDQTNGPQSGKPLRLLYADGSTSGTASTVDFEDWESNALARQVHFLWPDGSLLDAQEEAGLGDHMILTPTGNLDLQYMFVNRGGFDNADWNSASAGLGMAVLLNP